MHIYKPGIVCPAFFIYNNSVNETEKKNIKLVVGYDGTDYHGWQTQKNRPDLPTVQNVLEEIIEKLVRHNVDLRASGRTDAGVHANAQVASYFTDSIIPPERHAIVINVELNQIPDGKYIRVLSSEHVSDTFDSNTSARSKLYRYAVYNRRLMTPGCDRFAYYMPAECDVELMKQASGYFIGEHDFRSLANSVCDKKNTVRTVLRCDVWRKNHMIYYDIEGTGFLHNMVRNMVGLLIDIGRGKKPVDCIPEILAAKERAAAGNRAPANGLTLRWVRY